MLSVGLIFALGLPTRYLVDLDVYQHGVVAFWSGSDLYGGVFHTREAPLPFTYPPVAAVFLTPLVWLPDLVLTIISIGCLTVSTQVVLRQLQARQPSRLALALTPLMMCTEPVLATLMYGQINVILLALVILDASGTIQRRVPWFPPGVLIGIAAAIKLTPAFFLLFFFRPGRWRGLVGVALGFLVATGIGWVIRPAATIAYFSDVMFQTDRIGAAHYAFNVGIAGMLARLELSGLWWFMASLLVIAIIVVRIQYLDDLWALCITACGVLLVSPISWSHHWVWLPIITLIVLARGPAWFGAWLWFGCTVGCFHAFMPAGGHAELSWAWWQQVLAAHYALLAMMVLGWAGRSTCSKHQPTPATTCQ